MTQYIDKDALVAEIEKLKYVIMPYPTMAEKVAYRDGIEDTIKIVIKSLEVKEVDLEHLEQEVKDFCYKFDNRKDKWYDMTPHDKNIMISPTWSNFAMQLAKHFFELGMHVSNKAQKREEV